MMCIMDLKETQLNVKRFARSIAHTNYSFGNRTPNLFLSRSAVNQLLLTLRKFSFLFTLIHILLFTTSIVVLLLLLNTSTLFTSRSSRNVRLRDNSLERPWAFVVLCVVVCEMRERNGTPYCAPLALRPEVNSSCPLDILFMV